MTNQVPAEQARLVATCYDAAGKTVSRVENIFRAGDESYIVLSENQELGDRTTLELFPLDDDVVKVVIVLKASRS